MSIGHYQLCATLVLFDFTKSLLLTPPFGGRCMKVRRSSARQDPSDPSRAEDGLSPSEVVREQMEALRRGDLSRCYEFASENNKRATGPLAKFAAMLCDSPYYSSMIQCSRWELAASLRINEARHVVRVRVYPAGGATAAFSVVAPCLDFDFALSREAGELWRTDSVMPVSRKPPE